MPEADLLQACLDELDGVDDFVALRELAEQGAPVLLGRPGIARTADSEPNAPLDLFGVLVKRAQRQRLGTLPPVQSALDQILHRFGHDAVAEITGRSRRVLRIDDARGERLALRSRPGSANLA